MALDKTLKSVDCSTVPIGMQIPAGDTSVVAVNNEKDVDGLDALISDGSRPSKETDEIASDFGDVFEGPNEVFDDSEGQADGEAHNRRDLNLGKKDYQREKLHMFMQNIKNDIATLHISCTKEKYTRVNEVLELIQLRKEKGTSRRNIKDFMQRLEVEPSAQERFAWGSGKRERCCCRPYC